MVKRRLLPYGVNTTDKAPHPFELIQIIHFKDTSTETRIEGKVIALMFKQALAISFTEENIAQEIAYFQAEGRNSYERPYGLAWLLQLASELRHWDDEDAVVWSKTLQPLEAMPHFQVLFLHIFADSHENDLHIAKNCTIRFWSQQKRVFLNILNVRIIISVSPSTLN